MDRLAITSDLESVITLFCKNREMKFEIDNGWSEVLQLLCTLKLTKPALYNVFHAVVTKYIPLGCKSNGRPFDLFRLLLLYHDPVLCSVLDTKQITPDLYAKQWFNSLFAATCDLEIALKIWDVYLQQADPFLLFFMALVVLINARDQILENKDKLREDTVKFVRSLLYSLSAEDINDFCQLAMHYSSKTPQSFRRDYHGPLFGSNLTQAFESVTVHSLLCLPVSIQELLNTSANHNVTEIVNDPAKFQDIVQKLEELKQKSFPDSHWCFIGSGEMSEDDPDRFVYMVISYFLQKSVSNVSLARGGFNALHNALKESLSTRLKAHNVKECLVCKDAGRKSSKNVNVEEMTIVDRALKTANGTTNSLSKKSLSLFNKVRDAVKSKTGEVKEIVSDYVNSGSDANGGMSAVKHVDSAERHGKKSYRNSASVFTISEGSSDEMSDGDLPASEMDVITREKVKLKTWLNKPDVTHYFECQEIDDNRRTFDSHIVLTKSHLFILRDSFTCSQLPKNEEKGYAYVKSRRQLSSILKITSKRQYPELLTFKYGFELAPGEEKVTATERFFIPKAGDCAKAIKMSIVSLLQQKTVG
uniref:Rab-GAP TBC domain-containing protein n=1 Tax=Romanomermis culicivorax TaxID=13658 RepID=A0A915ID69_ROMCU